MGDSIPTIDEDYAKYLEFAAELEQALSAACGQETASTLFRRMNRVQFQQFFNAAAGDPNKERWLARFELAINGWWPNDAPRCCLPMLGSCSGTT